MARLGKQREMEAIEMDPIEDQDTARAQDTDDAPEESPSEAPESVPTDLGEWFVIHSYSGY